MGSYFFYSPHIARRICTWGGVVKLYAVASTTAPSRRPLYTLSLLALTICICLLPSPYQLYHYQATPHIYHATTSTTCLHSRWVAFPGAVRKEEVGLCRAPDNRPIPDVDSRLEAHGCSMARGLSIHTAEMFRASTNYLTTKCRQYVIAVFIRVRRQNAHGTVVYPSTIKGSISGYCVLLVVDPCCTMGIRHTWTTITATSSRHLAPPPFLGTCSPTPTALRTARRREWGNV